MFNKMFAVFDRKAKAFHPPFVLPNSDMAARTFADCINDPKHNYGVHPEDYTLYLIASWSQETGRVDGSGELEIVGNGVQYIRNSDSPDETPDETPSEI